MPMVLSLIHPGSGAPEALLPPVSFGDGTRRSSKLVYQPVEQPRRLRDACLSTDSFDTGWWDVFPAFSDVYGNPVGHFTS